MTNEQFAKAFESEGGYKKTVRAVLRRGVKWDAACEIAQAAWASAWVHLSELRDEGQIVAWVIAIAHRIWLTSFRKPELMAISDVRREPAIPESANVIRLDLYHAISKCKPSERELIEAFLAGYSQGELATKSGKSSAAIHAELSRTRKKLRKHLQIKLSGSRLPRISKPNADFKQTPCGSSESHQEQKGLV